MKRKDKSGFTLLEIIIVIIIVGVLASLALPRLFRTVEFSRSVEALNSMVSLRNSIERCYLPDQDYTNCNLTTIDVEDPKDSPGAHFSYLISSGADNYKIVATRNSFDNGNPTDIIGLQQTNAGVTRWGTGAFGSIR